MEFQDLYGHYNNTLITKYYHIFTFNILNLALTKPLIFLGSML